MIGLVTAGMAGGMAATLVSQNVFAAETEATTAREEHHEVMEELRETVQDAVESGDYAAWSAQMNTMADTMYQNMKAGITQENFDLLTQIHAAREAGDMDTVRELSQQLSGPMPMFGGRGAHGMRGGKGIGMHRFESQTDSANE